MLNISRESCFSTVLIIVIIMSSLTEWKRKVENASANKQQLHLDVVCK